MYGLLCYQTLVLYNNNNKNRVSVLTVLLDMFITKIIPYNKCVYISVKKENVKNYM
jgi:hypothetical protein